MNYKVNVYRKIVAWEKETHDVIASTKEEAVKIGEAIASLDNPQGTFTHWEILPDTIRYNIDKADVLDISYEVSIDGEMLSGGGSFAEQGLRRAVDKL